MDDQQWRAAENEWSNNSNWHWGIYVSPRDPRIWIRKRDPRFGWTFNFAHPLSWVWFAGLACGVPWALILLRHWLSSQ